MKKEKNEGFLPANCRTRTRESPTGVSKEGVLWYNDFGSFFSSTLVRAVENVLSAMISYGPSMMMMMIISK